MLNILEKCYEYWDDFWHEYVCRPWDWFWYYRRGKIKFHVILLEDCFKVSACNGNEAVWNCYGNTLEEAKEIALWRLKYEK